MDTPTAVLRWLRDHPDEARFKSTEIAAACGVHSTAVSAALRRYADDGTYPSLVRLNRTTWSLTGKPRYRITADAPLRVGARLEVVGHDAAGTVIVRDQAGRLWVLRPLELPA